MPGLPYSEHLDPYHLRVPAPEKPRARNDVHNRPAESGWVIVNIGRRVTGPRWQVQCLPGGPLGGLAEAIALALLARVPCNERGIVPLGWYKRHYYQSRLPVSPAPPAP